MAHRTRLLALVLGVVPVLALAQRLNEYDIVARMTAAAVEKARDAEPRAWKRIPWVASLARARETSLAECVPVFLFAHIGNMGMGRC